MTPMWRTLLLSPPGTRTATTTVAPPNLLMVEVLMLGCRVSFPSVALSLGWRQVGWDPPKTLVGVVLVGGLALARLPGMRARGQPGLAMAGPLPQNRPRRCCFLTTTKTAGVGGTTP
jgi:hypothetical protein